jgi:membrane-bound lytic murein transglycosylase MltF
VSVTIFWKEKLDWLLEALENNEIQIVSGGLTEEEKKEISREIAEYRATHPKPLAKEAVLA